jgi:hypothetical protein
VPINCNSNKNLTEINDKILRSRNIKSYFKNKDLVHICDSFQLTKTENNFSEAYLFRDYDLERNTFSWLSHRCSMSALIEKYRNFSVNPEPLKIPDHWPVRILAGSGSISSGKNIFMFFPQVLGVNPVQDTDIFGLEFIDVWSNIFNKIIFPIVKNVCCTETQFEIAKGVGTKLDQTVYLASLFHEIGHQVGPYKVSPTSYPNMKLKGFLLDVMGELSTDSMLVSNLDHFPEIAQFIILQRLFWFGRRGFSDNPKSALVNRDNDSWLGSYLWQKLIDKEVLQFTSTQKLIIDFKKAAKIFHEIAMEIHVLISTDQSEEEQFATIRHWMNKGVPNQGGIYQLPNEFQQILSKVSDFPETPHFSTPLNLFDINKSEGIQYAF